MIFRENEFVEEYNESGTKLIVGEDRSFDKDGIQNGFMRLILLLRELLNHGGVNSKLAEATKTSYTESGDKDYSFEPTMTA